VKTRRLTFILTLFGFFSSWSSSAQASPEDADRFSKCYLQFTGEVISPSDSRLAEIQAGTLTGTQACEQLLNSANLIHGSLKKDGLKEEGKKLLNQFTVINNSFFIGTPDFYWFQRYEFDTNDRAYYLLNALFSTDENGRSNYPFKKIFTDSTVYRAEREVKGTPNGIRNGELDAYFSLAPFSHIQPYNLGPYPSPKQCNDASKFGWGWWECTSGFTYQYSMIQQIIFDRIEVKASGGYLVPTTSWNYSRDTPWMNGNAMSIGCHGYIGDHFACLDHFDWTLSLEDSVSVGQIIGLKPLLPRSLPHAFQRAFNDSDGYARNYMGLKFKQPYPSPVENIYENYKTGIFFTPSTQPSMSMTYKAQNGINQVPRRWVQDFFKNFLCRDLPVIRAADGRPHVEQKPNPYGAFRNSGSCMRCHASMDALATISRNYEFLNTDPLNMNPGYVNYLHYPTKPDVSTPATEPDDFFPVRPARGNFRYRDYTGQIHDVELTATASDRGSAFTQLANYMSQIDDPYVCLTSRYFEFFTGIPVNFGDPGDPDTLPPNPREKILKSYVHSLGKDLRKTGNLRQTIMKIISSEMFLDPDKLPKESPK